MTSSDAPRIAVLIPCYNEEIAVGNVVGAFRAALPEAMLYAYDNNSRDGTAATGAGAIVRCEPLQGNGNVVRRMFADIEADIYVLVDALALEAPGARDADPPGGRLAATEARRRNPP